MRTSENIAGSNGIGLHTRGSKLETWKVLVRTHRVMTELLEGEQAMS